MRKKNLSTRIRKWKNCEHEGPDLALDELVAVLFQLHRPHID